MRDEMDMMAAAPEAEVGEYAAADAFAREVMVARGADPAMIDALPPLSADMVSDDLMLMMEDYGMAGMADEEAMFAEAVAEDEARGMMG